MESEPNRRLDPDELNRSRYEVLKRKQIESERDLENSKNALDDLKKQAREQYGTDDLASLRNKLEEMRRENEQKRAEYDDHLTSIEARLKEVEAQQSGSLDQELEE